VTRQILQVNRAARLLFGLLHAKRAYTGPLFVDLDLTRRCNLDCIGCPYHSDVEPLKSVDPSARDMSLDLIRRLAEELSSLGRPEVILAGTGEPLLHPRFVDILGILKEKQLRVHIITNGTLLDGDRARAIVRSGVDRITVSLWASSPEEYARCHSAAHPGYFSKVIANLKQLSRLKEELGRRVPAVYFNHVSTRDTYDTIDVKVDLARETGCAGILFNLFYPFDADTADAMLTDEQRSSLSRTFPAVRKRMNRLGLLHNITAQGILGRLSGGRNPWQHCPCYVGWYQTCIRLDGAVMPCCRCNLVVGDLNRTSFAEIWNGPPYQDFRIRSRTSDAMRSLPGTCQCDWCCFMPQNLRIHRIVKWFGPPKRSAARAGGAA
jgi:MoaA/NifB/PqqE/SkfB family radical SAM enzyme